MTKVGLAKAAQLQYEAIERYSAEHHIAAFDTLSLELLDAIDLLEVHPEAGHAFPLDFDDATRRVFLDESDYFLYYEYDAARDVVTITSIWYAKRGDLPEPPSKRKKAKG